MPPGVGDCAGGHGHMGEVPIERRCKAPDTDVAAGAAIDVVSVDDGSTAREFDVPAPATAAAAAAVAADAAAVVV